MVQLTITVLTVLAALAATSFTLAAPVLDIHGHYDTPVNSTLIARDLFEGSIHFFSHGDCEAPCHFDPGWCISPIARRTGDLNPPTAGHWATASDIRLCWNVPADTKSVSLTVETGHGYEASNLDCDELAIAFDTHNYDNAKPFPAMNSGGAKETPWECNGGDKLLEGIKSIAYKWKR